jgi:nicotinamide riboside transporter PnuC
MIRYIPDQLSYAKFPLDIYPANDYHLEAMGIVQISIFVLGATAIWFVSRRERWSRWGYIIGLISQPFWLYTTIKNQQWGMVALSVWYTYSWFQGIWNFWIREEKDGMLRQEAKVRQEEAGQG